MTPVMTVEQTRMRTLSLYRALLREAGRIEYDYPRAFWRLRIRDRFRHAQLEDSLKARSDQVTQRKIKDSLKDLRRLRESNLGRMDAVRWMLENAYGRRGKLRSEIISNITSSPAPPRAPIIPSVPSSRPPSLPPPLLALLSFSPARKTAKVLSAETMHTPPALPPRAVDPNGEEARLLGPFSLRRTANIHKRFVRAEVGRTVPPLELRLKAPVAAAPSAEAEKSSADDGAVRSDSNSRIELMLSGTPPVGLEGTRVFEELEELAKAPPRPIPRRVRVRASERASSSQWADIPELASTESTSSNGTDSLSPLNSQFQSRFMRRRFAEILAQTPILARPSAIPILSSTSSPSLGKSKTNKPRKNAQGGWTASLSPLALTKSATLGQAATARVSASDLTWIERSKEPAAAPASRGGDKRSNFVGPESDTR